jgi:hypothetical protein
MFVSVCLSVSLSLCLAVSLSLCLSLSVSLYISLPPSISLCCQVVQYESGLALHGGEDGLDVIRDILRLTPPLLSPPPSGAGARRLLLWMEVSHTHPHRIEELVQGDPGTSTCTGTSTSTSCDDSGAESGGAESSGGGGAPRFEFSGGFSDLYGQPRFVKLALARPPARRS